MRCLLAAVCSVAALHEQPLGAQQPPATVPSPAPTLNLSLADDVAKGLLRQQPEIGTYLGLPDARHGAIQDNSLSAREKREAEEDQWRDRLAAIDASAIPDGPGRAIHGILSEMLQASFDTRVCQAELWNVDQIGGWQVRYGQLAQMQPIDTAALQTAALARFGALAIYADREVANLREGLRRGYTAPRGNVEQVIEQMTGFAAASSPYY